MDSKDRIELKKIMSERKALNKRIKALRDKAFNEHFDIVDAAAKRSSDITLDAKYSNNAAWFRNKNRDVCIMLRLEKIEVFSQSPDHQRVIYSGSLKRLVEGGYAPSSYKDFFNEIYIKAENT